MRSPPFRELQMHALMAEQVFLGLPFYPSLEESFARIPVLRADLAELQGVVDMISQYPELAAHLSAVEQ